MKTLLLSLLLLFSVESFSQTYISDFMTSYRLVEGDPIFLESSVERNVFYVNNGYMIWASDDTVRYKIKDVQMIDNVLHYFLEGKDNHPLLLSVKGKIMSLIFDSNEGDRYAIKFSLN